MFYSANGMTMGDPDLTAGDYNDILNIMDAASVPGSQAQAFSSLQMKLRSLRDQAVQRQYAPAKAVDEAADKDLAAVDGHRAGVT